MTTRQISTQTGRFADSHATRLEQLLESTFLELALASLWHRLGWYQGLLAYHHVDFALYQVQFSDAKLLLTPQQLLLVSLLLIQ